MQTLIRLTFAGPGLSRTNFSGADLTDANFQGAKIAETIFAKGKEETKIINCKVYGCAAWDIVGLGKIWKLCIS
jgi:uncharacterized protein YjbI with pentapeptide repeats